jgi:hypothetical protein
VVLLAAVGCGSKSGAVPVSGVVKLDGQPLTSAAVSFIAQEPGGRDAHGSTDATGAFRLTTFDPGDGALPGKYKVVIQPAGEGGGATPFDDPSKPAPRAAPKAPRGPKLPAKYTRVDQTVLTQDVPASGPVLFELQSH